MLYKRCPYCGANLDPGERCDCLTIDQPEMELAFRRRAPRRPSMEEPS